MEELHHDENTMYNVREGLRAVGLCETDVEKAIQEMQNRGILFRVVKPLWVQS